MLDLLNATSLDIFIKSFNRPYYLERCLKSIHQYVVGDYKVILLDDGTPEQYLDRIKELFPLLKISKSAAYTEKTNAIASHISGYKQYDNTNIPVQLWKDSIANSSDIFLLLEEDTWLKHPLDLDQMRNLIKQLNLLKVKLSWHGNDEIVKGEKIRISEEVEEIIPSLPVNSVTIMKFLFTNTLKIRSILFKTGILSMKNLSPYYALYTVTSAFFDKRYWLHLWDGAGTTVNEIHQLLKALEWSEQLKGSRYAKTLEEYINSSFITSCTNYFKVIEFDMIQLNYYLNEAWFKGELNALQNFPLDFPIDYLKGFLPKDNNKACSPGNWDKWIDLNKGLFRSVGCNID